MKKSTKVMVTSAFVFGLALAGSSAANAASASGMLDSKNNLANAIALKFNLNTSDVQKVLDEQHSEMQARHLEMQKTYLADAVKKGKLTQAQMDLIIAKKAELEASRQATHAAMEGKSKSERDTYMRNQIESLKTWMTTNNIPQEYMMSFRAQHGMRGGDGSKISGRGQADSDLSLVQ